MVHDSKTNQSYNVHEIFFKRQAQKFKNKSGVIYSWKLFKQIKNSGKVLKDKRRKREVFKG